MKSQKFLLTGGIVGSAVASLVVVPSGAQADCATEVWQYGHQCCETSYTDESANCEGASGWGVQENQYPACGSCDPKYLSSYSDLPYSCSC